MSTSSRETHGTARRRRRRGTPHRVRPCFDRRAAAYAYDALGRLTSVGFAGTTQRYAYDAVGNPTAATFANGTRSAASYDALDRPTSPTSAEMLARWAAIGVAGVAAAGEARADAALRRGLAEALRLRQLAAVPDPNVLMRLPIVRDVRTFGLQAQANVREVATRLGAGSLRLLYRVSATAGGVLTASSAAAEQLQQDAPRYDLSVDARLARAAFRGIVTGASSAVAGVAAGVACAPATLTVIGAALTAGCAVGGAAAGEAFGSAISGSVLQTVDPRFGF